MHMGTTTTTTIASNHHNDSKIFKCLGTYAINNDNRTARWEASEFFVVQGKIMDLFYLSKPQWTSCCLGWLCLVTTELNIRVQSPFHHNGHFHLFSIQTLHHSPKTCSLLCRCSNFKNLNGGKGWAHLGVNVHFFFFLVFFVANFLHQDGIPLQPK
jgi:hypothetical protein